MNTTEVENFPGFRDGIQGPAADGRDACPGRALRRRAGRPTTSSRSSSRATSRPCSTEDGTFTARTVILAMGSGYRKLGIPDEDRLSGHGVSWCATCDGFFFREQHIAVVGGGDSAVEEATFLSRFGSKVTLVSAATSCAPRRSCRSGRSPTRRSRSPGTPRWPIHGDDKLTGVILQRHGHRRDLRSWTRPACSSRSATTRARSWSRARSTSTTRATCSSRTRPRRPTSRASSPRGDLVDHHYRQAITAAGSGCAAALDAERYLAALDHAASIAGTAEQTAAEDAAEQDAPRVRV